MITGAVSDIVYLDSDGMPVSDGEFQRLELQHESDGRVWMRSDTLNLGLWWEDGELQFWDPVAERWIRTAARDPHLGWAA